VVRAADSGNSDGLLNHTVMALGEFRPARGAAAYTTTDGADLDNSIVAVIKDTTTSSNIDTINYVSGVQTTIGTISTNFPHEVPSAAFLHNPSIGGTNYASGILLVLLVEDVDNSVGSWLPSVRAYNVADGVRVSALEKILAFGTTVNGDSASGQKVLNVPVTTGFAPNPAGDLRCVIGYGTAREEVQKAFSLSAGVSITMVANLDNTHTAAQADTVYQTYSTNEVAEAICPLQQAFGGWAASFVDTEIPNARNVRFKRENIDSSGSTSLAVYGSFGIIYISPLSKASHPMIYVALRGVTSGSQLGLLSETIDNSISGAGTGTVSQLSSQEFVQADWADWTDRPDTVLQIDQIPILSPLAAQYGNSIALLGNWSGTVGTINQVTEPRLALISGPTQGATLHDVLLSHADHASYKGHGFAISGDGYVYVCGTGDFVTDSDSADSDKILIFKVAAWDFSTILASFRHRVEVDGTTDSSDGLGGAQAYGGVASTRVRTPIWDGHRLLVIDDDASQVRLWSFDKDLNAISVKQISSGATQPGYPPNARMVSAWTGRVY